MRKEEYIGYLCNSGYFANKLQNYGKYAVLSVLTVINNMNAPQCENFNALLG